MKRLWMLMIALSVLIASAPVLPQITGQVIVRVTLDGQPTDALIFARDRFGKLFIAYTDLKEIGLARLTLPQERYTLIVDHGAGFTVKPFAQEITVQIGQTLSVTAALQRAFSPAREWGYYSADLHAHSTASPDGHTPIEQLVLVQLAADLDLVFISDHETIAGHELFAKTAQARGAPSILSEEITTPQGHWNAYPLKCAVTYAPGKTPKDYFAQARACGAQVIQANHPAGVGDYFALLGTELFDDSFDAVEIFNGEFDQGDARAIEYLFRFWNEGRRYVAVGTSDDHDWLDFRPGQERYGRPRTYVRVEGELTADKWIAALKAGRAFATYGPLVNFTAQEGRAFPGDTVTLARGQEIALRAEVLVVPREAAQERVLQSAQIIKNGRVLRAFSLSEDRAVITLTDRPTEQSWYLVRVIAEDGDQAYTNPIWVEVRL
ncbi:MAG: CehA/McbA family metallohydrolase [Candidatus Bipolaricaulota bacterium]|nr:CehA/McbA family metallohydrolase [Candidatus Bipolaricaulota bacterium]MDW8140730.1 CehA/McbA family metallohydrolase [Candidatus Bipolaricaulota bacterium]